ncbi:transcriptional regulator [Conexivisphaera calida]|nr:transcriptional regulator [Conexivisphaera calida]
MHPPCEVMVKVVLPAFRSLVARRLAVNYGLPQTDIARLLGITQPSISFYLSSKRGKWIEMLENNPKISEMADQFAAALAQGNKSQEELDALLCQLCTTFREIPEFKDVGYAVVKR